MTDARANDLRNPQPAAAAAGTTVLSERWLKPSSAHANDIEFESATIPASLSLYVAAGTTEAITDATVNPYVDNTAAHHANAHTNRASWLAMQVKRNNTRYYLMQDYTAPTNVHYWSRVAQSWRAVDDGCDIGIVLAAQSAGAPDFNNRVEIVWSDTTAGRKLTARKVVAGATTNVNTPGGQASEQPGLPYLGIHKLGSTWWFRGFPEGAGEYVIGTTSQAFTMKYAGWVFQNNSNSPGGGIALTDFARFVESDTFVP